MSNTETVSKKLHTILTKAETVSLIIPTDISSDTSVVNDLTDAYSEYNDILRLIDDLYSDVDDIVQPHLNIQASDEQYEDPEFTWGSTLLENLKEAKQELESCANDLDFIISEIEVGDDIDGNEFLVYEYEIGNFIKIINKTIKENKE